MASDLEIPFDRVTYRDGQLLDARDLGDDHRGDARLWRLHTRYLHGTWGIALGFEVSQVNEKREKVESDGKAVVVGPGDAVDEMGRDLLLAETIEPPLPRVSARETFVLTVRYQEDREFRARRELSVLCLGEGLDPRQERPLFSWRRPEEVRFGPELPLVQVTVENGLIVGKLDLRVRRYARPHFRPHMGFGVTEEGRSGWGLWQEGSEDDKQDLGLELKVDTAEAGFTKTPFYFPLLQGDFSNQPNREPLFEPDLWPEGKEPMFSLDVLGFIASATNRNFVYRIINAEQPPSNARLFPFARVVTATEAESRRWRVAWLGVEPVSGCEPVLDFARIFSLSGFPIFTLARFISGRREV